MPVPTKPTEAHKQIIAQLLSEDVELRVMARQFVVLGFQELINQLHRGDQATRAQIARSLSGVITKAIADVDEDDTVGGLRAEFHAMIGEMRGEMAGDDLDTDPPTFPRVVPKAR